MGNFVAVVLNDESIAGEEGTDTTLQVSGVNLKDGEQIFAVGYNQEDGAYKMSSIVKDKEAQFSNYKMRKTTNITLFTEE